MDPLVALGVAANVAQFVQFAGHLMGQGWALYRNGESATELNLTLVTRDLHDIARRLAGNAPPQEGQTGLSEEDASLKKLCDRSTTLSKDLLSILEDLSVSSPGQKWQSFRQAMRAVGKRKKLGALEYSLGELREQMNFHMLITLGKQQSRVLSTLQSIRQDARTTKLDSSKFAELLSRVEERQELWLKQRNQGRDREREKGQGKKLLHELLAQQPQGTVEDLEDESTFVPQLFALHHEGEVMRAKLTVLFSLRFSTMDVRKFDISPAHRNTFQWIYKEPRQGWGRKTDFASWLRTGDGTFWISGKPGSGKSTLCKFLISHPQTEQELQHWTGTKQLFMPSYFFSRTGNDLQSSLVGLLRTIMYDVLRQCPELISDIYPERWKQARYSSEACDVWTKAELLHGLRSILTCNLPARFCLLVDGLDEYAGDPTDIVRLLKDLATSPDIKICISSRPWNVFQDAFGREQSKMLRLQDLTHNDICNYIYDHLENDSYFAALASVYPSYHELVKELVEKADGVFLWVLLVIKELLRGLTDGDTMRDLQDRLRSLPSDLDEYFRHILDSVDDHQTERSARTLQLCVHAKSPLPISCFSLLDEGDPDLLGRVDFTEWSHELVKEKNKATIRRLNARCKGLVEIRYPHLPLDTSCVVRFLHRTVRDFLDTPQTQSYLRQNSEDDFAPYNTLLELWLAYMRLLREVDMSPDGFSDDWAHTAVYYASKMFEEQNTPLQQRNTVFDQIGDEFYLFLGHFCAPKLENWEMRGTAKMSSREIFSRIFNLDVGYKEEIGKQVPRENVLKVDAGEKKKSRSGGLSRVFADRFKLRF